MRWDSWLRCFSQKKQKHFKREGRNIFHKIGCIADTSINKKKSSNSGIVNQWFFWLFPVRFQYLRVLCYLISRSSIHFTNSAENMWHFHKIIFESLLIVQIISKDGCPRFVQDRISICRTINSQASGSPNIYSNVQLRYIKSVQHGWGYVKSEWIFQFSSRLSFLCNWCLTQSFLY